MKKTGCLFVLLLAACCLILFVFKRPNNTAAVAPVTASVKYENLPDVLLVNADHPLPEDFAPKELVNLYGQKRHFLLANSSIELEREAFEAANRMFKLAEDEDMNGFILTSGYRTRERQAELFAESTDGTAQRPGCSEHETGLAFDVTARYDSGTFEDTPQFAWLYEHCWDFGFILRYPKGKTDITGIAYESWHYRYVGEEAARIIRENGWTLEEYFVNAERNGSI
ncbi:MAG: M15 family metallopeptidase [Clostridia bacterium]|nr:M15 family metallopeptidase [Clostridia bacterium]